MRIRLAILTLAVCLASTVRGAAAQTSANVPVTANLQSGTLSIAYLSGGLTFTGPAGLSTNNIQIPSSTTFTLVIDDQTGSGAGWHVTFQMTDLADGFGHVINHGQVEYVATNVVALTITGQPASAANGPSELTQTLSFGNQPFKVLNVAAGSGAGEYQYTPIGSNFILFVPAGQAAGTYTGTLTATVATGP